MAAVASTGRLGGFAKLIICSLCITLSLFIPYSHSEPFSPVEEIFPMAVDVYLFNFNDSRVECTVDDVYSRVFGPHPSVRTLIEHSSYGRTTLHLKPRADNERTVFGPITLPFSWKDISCLELDTPKNSPRGSVFDPANFTASDWNANDAGVEDMFPNKRLLFVYPREIAQKCRVGGESYRDRVFIAKCDRSDLFLHELGHQLRFDHGAADPDDALSDQFREYGDDSTVMGSADAGFNAPEAINAGWIPSWAIQTTQVSNVSLLESLNFVLAPLETMPEDLLSLPGKNASLAVRIKFGCSEYLISFRSRTSLFGSGSLIDAALPDNVNDACLLHRVINPTRRRPLMRSNLIHIVRNGVPYNFEKPGEFSITISCSARRSDGTVDLTMAGNLQRSQSTAASIVERPAIPRVTLNTTSVSQTECAVLFTMLQRESPVSAGYGIGFVGVAELVDPSCMKTSLSLQVATNFSYFHLSVYPSVLEFDMTKTSIRSRFFRIVVAAQWEISGPWTLILAKLVVSAPNNSPVVLSVSIRSDLRPLIPRLPIRVDEFHVVCPTSSCIGADALLNRPGSFCCSVAFRGQTYRSPSLTLRMKDNPSYRALLPYTLYPGGSEWITLADMHGFGVVASGSESNETLAFELVEGSDNVVGRSYVRVPFDNCNTLPSLQLREPDPFSYGPRKPFEIGIPLSIRMNAITFETAACPARNYTYSILASDTSSKLVNVDVVYSRLTTESASWIQDASLVLSPAKADLSELDSQTATLLIEANDSPLLGARAVNLIFKKPDISIRVVSMPRTFRLGAEASSMILVQVLWNGSSVLEAPCTPRRLILITESSISSARIPFPYLSFEVRSNEPKIVPIEYIWNKETPWWSESDDLTFYVWMTDIGAPLDAWGSAWQTPTDIEVTSPFVSKTVLPIHLRSNPLIVVGAVLGSLVGAAVIGTGLFLLYRKRYSIGFSLVGNNLMHYRGSSSNNGVFADLEMSNDLNNSSGSSNRDSSGSDSDLK